MSNKNYRTLDGIFKALAPIVQRLAGECKIERNDEDIAIYCNNYVDEPFGGYAIIRLLPVLKRATWMVRRNSIEKRIELLVWVNDDNF